MRRWTINWVRHAAAGFAGLTLALGTVPGNGQPVRSVDPNTVIDADLDQATAATSPAAVPTPPNGGWTTEGLSTEEATAAAPASPPGEAAAAAPVLAGTPSQTYQRDDLIGAAEGLFGRGAEGLARMIEDVLREQGEPNGYIVGRELGGALVFGVRYGSGTLHHRIEGERPVYWTGPSLGLDAGANAGNTFVLVYNLHDSQELFRRFPAGEGTAYLVGGFNASYLRRGNIVLIPIRMGLGARLGVNVGYMKFSQRQRWLPF
ncbi:DUF1134 domain-containing protein [Sphingomonas lacunae]|uniref:DUF1134 domain-containing protein n=1 Tax=Sphingomonas lacunae TaxID=2698828 RepID=A0A6M4AU21_9SPHN|nr:DUF1134 domain-containing protein [Sphingomonas lacunae]QJQ32534.1 DUF1134 domain-containing protein [Sphingomonas lacunae]